MRTSIQAAVAVALVLGSTGAFAENSAEATLSLDFTLVDLDPADGITPWLTVGPLGQAVAKSSAFSPDTATQDESDGVDFSSISSSSVAGIETGDAFIQGQGFVGSVVFHSATSANALGGATTASAIFDSAVGGFLLSPRTELDITGSFSVSAQTTSTYPVSSVSWAGAFLPGGLSANAGTIIAQGITTQGFASDDLHDSHVNDSDQPLEFGMLIGVTTFSWSPALATPMPEPSGGLLLLGGLVGLGAAARIARARHAGPTVPAC